MGAACTSSYQATQPDWHLLGIAAPQADRSTRRHTEGRQNHGSDLRVATPQTFSLSKPTGVRRSRSFSQAAVHQDWPYSVELAPSSSTTLGSRRATAVWIAASCTSDNVETTRPSSVRVSITTAVTSWSFSTTSTDPFSMMRRKQGRSFPGPVSSRKTARGNGAMSGKHERTSSAPRSYLAHRESGNRQSRTTRAPAGPRGSVGLANVPRAALTAPVSAHRAGTWTVRGVAGARNAYRHVVCEQGGETGGSGPVRAAWHL
jgi:hypothetical protein